MYVGYYNYSTRTAFEDPKKSSEVPKEYKTTSLTPREYKGE